METPTYADSQYGSSTPKQISYRQGQTPNFLSPTLDFSTYMGNSHTYSNPPQGFDAVTCLLAEGWL